MIRQKVFSFTNCPVALCVVVISATVTMVALSPALAAPKKACTSCHQRLAPKQVATWKASAHGKAGIGCKACHGRDHLRMKSGDARVGVQVCGRCHPKAKAQHERSRHGMGLHSGWGCTRALPKRDARECRFCHVKGSQTPQSNVQCARFLTQTASMAEAGCNRCHQVERSCASCHTNHSTSLKIVRSPAVCAKCHMGPDHPQWEMWKTSQHGTLFSATAGKKGPTCQTCHLPRGGHNVSTGLTMSPAGDIYPPKTFAARRKSMLKVCSRCHSRAFSKRELKRGDKIRVESRQLVAKAKKIIEGLYDRKLLDPMPENRPAHPQRGKVLVLDNQILYEDTSHIERLYFTMKKFYLAQTVKGAYHQNPAYTHWLGNSRLKMALVDIRAEASRLEHRTRGTRAKPKATPANHQRIELQLRQLQHRHKRGELSKTEYNRARQDLLKRFTGSKN